MGGGGGWELGYPTTLTSGLISYICIKQLFKCIKILFQKNNLI